VTPYLLACANQPDGLPVPVGVLAAADAADGVIGEAAVGVGASEALVKQATQLLRDLPAAMTTAGPWLEALAGTRNGDVMLTGPWEWEAEMREVVHWAMTGAGLRAKAVATIRDGVVSPYG